ncbi:O-antigen ligase [Selenomonas ruminantium]|uniref:O-antigen ligase family protein n=1 Tax=Selenomonas ruminantium TaxID=971 RepID=UPI0026E943FD|nr:O-antigen ligase family protein [Selenomonas ruminantium]
MNKLEDVNGKSKILTCVMVCFLWGGLCFTTSDNILLLSLIVSVGLFFYIYKILMGSLYLSINKYIIWFVMFNFLLGIYGNLTWYGGYSLPYHILISIMGTLFFLFLQINEKRILAFMCRISMIAGWVTGGYVLYSEFAMLQEKIPLIIMKQSWYRLGDASNWNPNSIAILFSLLSIFTFAYMAKNGFDKLYFLSYVFQVFIVLLSGSKKGIVVLLLTYAYFAFSTNNIKYLIKRLLLSLVGLIIIMIVIFQVDLFYNLLGYRIVDMLTTLGLSDGGDYSNSTDLRAGMIEKALEMIPENLFLGGGWNSFAITSGYYLYSHNTMTEILLSMGLLGFSCYYSLHLWLIGKNILLCKYEHARYNLFLLAVLLFLDMGAVNIYGSMTSFFMLGFVFLNNKEGYNA